MHWPLQCSSCSVSLNFSTPRDLCARSMQLHASARALWWALFKVAIWCVLFARRIHEHTLIISVNYTPNTEKVWKAHLSEEHTTGVQRTWCAVCSSEKYSPVYDFFYTDYPDLHSIELIWCVHIIVVNVTCEYS